jgi:hypothetical protein
LFKRRGKKVFGAAWRHDGAHEARNSAFPQGLVLTITRNLHERVSRRGAPVSREHGIPPARPELRAWGTLEASTKEGSSTVALSTQPLAPRRRTERKKGVV